MKKLKGFSSSTYTEIPSNFSMDFGTEDFSIVCWKDSKGNITTYKVENYNKNKDLKNPKWLSLEVGEYFLVTVENGKIVHCTEVKDKDQKGNNNDK